METSGVLVIDTGEILSSDGQLQDPAKNLLKPGDYIVALNQQKISCKQDLIDDLKDLDGSAVTVSIRRKTVWFRCLSRLCRILLANTSLASGCGMIPRESEL